MNIKYYLPKIEDFKVGFEYEEFETILLDKYRDKEGHFIIPGFDIYSKEYFKELHSKDKYWKHRKWIKKIINKNSVFNMSDSIFKQKYIPLNIDNIIRVKYLDKEDIENSGFKIKNHNEISIYGKIKNYRYYYTIENFGLLKNRIFIIKLKFNKGDKFINDNILFRGNIKNKSELKKLLEQLNIK